MIRRMRRSARRSLRSKGYDIVRLGWHPETIRGLCPVEPSWVIDVGAATGTPDLYAAFPSASILAIDPIPDHIAELERLQRDRLVPTLAAAGERAATTTIDWYPTDGEKSSLLTRSRSDQLGDHVRIDVTVRPLDEITAEHHVHGPAVLKIDVEGAEMSVLRGATGTLAASEMVIVETTLAGDRFADGRRSASDVVSLLADAGFELADVLEVARAARRGVYADLLFVRT